MWSQASTGFKDAPVMTEPRENNLHLCNHFIVSRVKAGIASSQDAFLITNISYER